MFTMTSLRWLIGLMCLALPARAQDAWTVREALPTPRRAAAAAALDGLIYVAGGVDALGRVRDVVERYDPVADRWETDLPPLPEPRAFASAVVFEGRLYVLGGRDENGRTRDDVWVLDAGQWERFEDLDHEREGAAAVVLDEAIYVVGGSGEDGKVLDTATYYDPTTDHWEESADWHLDLARASFAAAVVGTSVYSIGGFSGFGPVGAVQRYDPGVGDEVMTPLYPPRGGLAAAALDGAIYVACGRGPGDLPLNEVDRFLPAEDRWETVAPLNAEREDCAMVALDGTLYVLGGRDLYGDVLGLVEAYAPAQAVAVAPPAAPAGFRLDPAYPNPFATAVTLPFSVDAPGPVRLDVYDLRGRRVAVLLDRSLAPGPHTVAWDGRRADGRRAAAGAYVYRLRVGGRQAVRTLVYLPEAPR